RPANSAISSNDATSESSLGPALTLADTGVTDTGALAVAGMSVASLPHAAPPAGEAPFAPALISARPSKPMTVSVGELQAENRRKQLLWKGLVIASSGAATFDAWYTRRAITTAGAQELNPLLRPFAGNASLYV